MSSQSSASRIASHDVGHSSTVLLLVDFINPLDFPGADELRAPAVEAAQRTARLKRQVAKDGIRAVYANDNYGFWHADFAHLWSRCSRARGESRKMANLLKPLERDFTVLKPRHSAFYATPLQILLEELKCRHLIVTGLAADSCVLFTAMDAYLRGLSVWVPSDCVAAETPRAKDQALELMAHTLKARTEPAFPS